MKKNQNLIVGIHPIIEAILAGKAIDKLFLQKGIKNERLLELKTLARERDIFYHFVPKEKLERLFRGVHQGAIAFTSPIEFADVEEVIQQVYENGEDPFILMLDRVSDVRNFGSIVRTAEAAGVHAIVIPHKGAAAINDDAAKTSAGALFRLPICKAVELEETLIVLKSSGLMVCAVSEKGDTHFQQAKLSGPGIYLMGSEGEGIEAALVKHATVHVRIPMFGKVSSLNVAVATGIALYEAQRQRLT